MATREARGWRWRVCVALWWVHAATWDRHRALSRRMGRLYLRAFIRWFGRAPGREEG